MATVPEIITSQQSIAANYISQASTFIDRVSNLSNAIFIPTELAIPDIKTGLIDITQDALDKINGFKPVRPASFGTIDALAPTPPVLNFADIDETLLDLVSAKLQADLTDGGYGIDANDEAALWQRERDREAQNALAKVDEIGRAYSQGGFSLPTGAMFAAMDRALQESSDKNSSVNRDIGIKHADMYVNARKFSIEQGASVERVLVELHRAVTEHMQVMTALYNSQISKYRADIDGGIEVIRSNVAIYAADISAFQAVIGAIGEAYRLKVGETGITNQWNAEVLRATLQNMKLNLEGSVGALKFRESAAQFGSTYFAGLVAAAINSLSAGAFQTEAT